MSERVANGEWRLGRSAVVAAVALFAIRYSLFAIVAVALTPTPARADPRADFLAGLTRNCSRCDLSGASFKRHDLAGADLTDADASGANFRSANFARANLAGASFRKGDLFDAHLDDAMFGDTTMPDGSTRP